MEKEALIWVLFLVDFTEALLLQTSWLNTTLEVKNQHLISSVNSFRRIPTDNYLDD